MAKVDYEPFGGGVKYKDLKVGMRVSTRDGMATVIKVGKAENPVIALYDTLVLRFDVPYGEMPDGSLLNELEFVISDPETEVMDMCLTSEFTES
jgi:hypothetical protein